MNSIGRISIRLQTSGLGNPKRLDEARQKPRMMPTAVSDPFRKVESIFRFVRLQRHLRCGDPACPLRPRGRKSATQEYARRMEADATPPHDIDDQDAEGSLLTPHRSFPITVGVSPNYKKPMKRGRRRQNLHVRKSVARAGFAEPFPTQSPRLRNQSRSENDEAGFYHPSLHFGRCRSHGLNCRGHGRKQSGMQPIIRDPGRWRASAATGPAAVLQNVGNASRTSRP